MRAFQSDAALDWLDALVKTRDLSMIEQALDDVLDVGHDYLEVTESEAAIAAGEVLARLMGRAGDAGGPNPALDAWVIAVAEPPTPTIGAKAVAAIRRTLEEPSEIDFLWRESDNHDIWVASVHDILRRIQG